jgi:hypothetical protein
MFDVLLAQLTLADVVDLRRSGVDVYEYLRMYTILAAGAVIGYAIHKRLGRMGAPIFFIFGIAADAQLHYAELCAADILRRINVHGVVDSSIWSRFWELLPAAILVLLAVWLWREARGLVTARATHAGRRDP